MELPVLANRQDMPATAGQVEALFDAGPLSGYLIAGHEQDGASPNPFARA